MPKLAARPPTTSLTLKLGSLNRPADRNAGLRPRQFGIDTSGPVAWSGGVRKYESAAAPRRLINHHQSKLKPRRRTKARRIAANIAKLPAKIMGRRQISPMNVGRIQVHSVKRNDAEAQVCAKPLSLPKSPATRQRGRDALAVGNAHLAI